MCKMLLLERCKFLRQIINFKFSCFVSLSKFLCNLSLFLQFFLFVLLWSYFLLLIYQKHLFFLLLLLLQLFLLLNSLLLHFNIFLTLDLERLSMHEIFFSRLVYMCFLFLSSYYLQFHLLYDVLECSLLFVLIFDLSILFRNLICHVFKGLICGSLVDVLYFNMICFLFEIWGWIQSLSIGFTVLLGLDESICLVSFVDCAIELG